MKKIIPSMATFMWGTMLEVQMGTISLLALYFHLAQVDMSHSMLKGTWITAQLGDKVQKTPLKS
jgi:hypothetical protein